MKRIAIIDLGTNTFNLLIINKSENDYSKVYETKVGVGLGFGGINKNIIQENALLRGLDTLKSYKEKCDELKVDSIFAFGTSALRNAENREDFLMRAKLEANIDIEVISGKREAELIYKGVIHRLPDIGAFMVMDIGGGSTEFVLGDINQVYDVESFEIGVARIYQLFDFSDPFSAEDSAVIEAYLDSKVGDFFDTIQIQQLVGSSGSFETFYQLIFDLRKPLTDYVELEKAALMETLDQIIHSTQAERDADERIILIRKKMIPIAAVKIRWIICKLAIEKIIVSPYALKEGVLKEIIF